MKRKQVMAVILSAVLSFSACVPMNSMRVLAAENDLDISVDDETLVDEETVVEDSEIPRGEEISDTGEGAVQEAGTDDQIIEEDSSAPGSDAVEDQEETGSGSEAPPADVLTEEEDISGDSDMQDPESSDGSSFVIEESGQMETDQEEARKSLVVPDESDFATATDIYVGDVLEVTIPAENKNSFFRFTPEEDGVYCFYSSDNDTDPYAGLYDSEGNEIARSDDGSDRNFCIESSLAKDSTYYLQACAYGESTGSYKVHLEKNEGQFFAEILGDAERRPSYDEEVTLEVNAFSNSELSFQWYSLGAEVEGETSNTYTFNAKVSGSYYCLVSDTRGHSETCYFDVYINNHLEAYAADSEDKEKYYYVTISPGESAVLRVGVSADDDSGLLYQWYDDNYNLIDGAEDAEYTAADQTGNYRCTVVDRYGNSETVYFHVTVENHLAAYPAESGEDSSSATVYVPYGESYVLSPVVTADDDSSLSYQWYTFEEDFYLGRSTSAIEGAKDASYTLDSVTGANNLEFRVTDSYGNSISVFYYVFVQNHLTAYPWGKEEGDTFDTLNVDPGDSPELKAVVSADDESGLTYQWYESDMYYDEYEIIPGANEISYTPDLKKQWNGYRFTVSDQYGNTRNVYFEVNVQNDIRAWATDSEYESTDYTIFTSPGSSVELKATVTAKDTGSLTRRWYHYTYNEENNSYDWAEIDGEASDSYTIASVNGYDRYWFFVSDQYGNTGSVYFSVYIQNNLYAWAEDSEDKNDNYTMEVSPGETAVMRVSARADDESSLEYQWHDNDGNLIEGESGSIYTVENVSGNFRCSCTVRDQYDNTSEVWFDINVNNHFRAYAADSEDEDNYYDVTVSPGESAVLRVGVSADDDSGLQYRWYDDYYDLIDGAEDAEYTVDQTGDYRCTVTDRYGNSKTVHFYVTVENHFDAYPAESGEGRSSATVYVPYGESYVLSPVVTADDDSGLSYQWYTFEENDYGFDITKINGANSASYTLDSVTGPERYELILKDAYGNSISIYYHVYVQNHLIAYPYGKEEEDSSAVINAFPGSRPELKAVVSADDDSKLTCQWYVREDDDWGEYVWNAIEEADSTSYTVGTPEDRVYKFVVRDQYGNSRTVLFYVYFRANLTAYPEGEEEDTRYKYMHLLSGRSAKLKAVVDADDQEGLTFTWYKRKTDEQDEYYYEVIEGANTDSYTVESVDQYSCYKFRASDSYGNECNLYYYLTPHSGLMAYPEGESQGETETWKEVQPGASLKLKAIVEAENMEDVSFQWYRDGSVIEGEQSDSFTIQSVDRNADYKVLVSDQDGNSEDVYFYVRVKNNLSVYAGGSEDESSFLSLYPLPGQSPELRAVVSADDAEGLTCHWYKYIYDKEEDYGEWEKIEGAVSDSYTVPPVAEANSEYRFTATDRFGNSESAYYYLYINTNLSATALDGNQFLVEKGASQQLRVDVSVFEGVSLTYEWVDLKTGEALSFDNSAPLTITINNIQTHNGIKFTATDPYGNSSSVTFNIYVKGVPKVYPDGAKLGETSVSHVWDEDEHELTVNGEYPEDYTYKWYDEDTGELLGEGSYSYYFELGNKNRNIRCRVSEADNAEHFIDLFYYIKTTAPSEEDFAGAKEIHVGDVETVTLSQDVPWILYKFIPEYTDNYSFYTSDYKRDPYGELYDAEFNRINRNDDGGENYNFRIEQVLEKDNTYYLKAHNYSFGEDSFTLHLERISSGEDEGKREQIISASDLSLTYPESGKVIVTGAQGALSYQSENNSIATVDEEGTVTAVRPGTTQIRVTATATDLYNAGSTQARVTVTKGEQTLSAQSIEIPYPQSKQLTVSGAEGALTYESQDDSVATVDSQGNVTAVKPGSTKITILATATDLYNAGSTQADVTVVKGTNNIQANDLALTYPETAVINATAEDGAALSYASDNEDVATVDKDGKVTAKKAGSATITITAAETDNYKEASKTINVTIGKADQTLTAQSIEIPYPQSKQLTVSGAEGALTYESQDDSVATVDSQGNVTAVKPGSTKITILATTTDLYKAARTQADVTVVKGTNNIQANDLELTYPETADINAAAEDGAVLSYASDNEDVATVDKDGKVTAKKAGSATITITAAETDNYKEASKTINVTIGKADQSLAAEDLSLTYPDSGKITVSGAQGALSFESSDDTVASVDTEGNVTANKVGSVTITITSAETDNYKETSKTINVTIAKADQSLAAEDLSLTYPDSGKITVSGAQGALSFESSDNTVASVDKDGNVTANKAGSATITITAAETDSYKAAAKTINVAIAKGEQTLAAQSIEIPYSQSRKLTVSGAKTALTYENQDDSVATVDSQGNVTAVKLGSTKITILAAETDLYHAARTQADVTVVKGTNNIKANDLALTYPETAVINATAEEGAALSYASDNEDVAAVDNDGNVTANKAGSATITITAAETDNYKETKKTINVTIAKANQTITGPAASYSKTHGDKAFSLGAEAMTTLSYTSSNVNVAAVSSAGEVTVKGAGTATITITAAADTYYNKATKTVTVTVKKANQTITGPAASYSKTFGDKAFSLGAKAKTALSYASSNTKAATVSSKGEVTVKGVGTATITITITAAANANYNKATKTVTVTVKKANQAITGPAASYSKTFGNKAFALGAKAKTSLSYASSNTKAATVSSRGEVTIKGAGTAKITITAAANANYNKATKTVTVSVAKAAPTISVKTTSRTYTVSALKKAAQTFSLGAIVNSKGKLSYKKSSGSSAITVGSNGNITVKKGTKKGTYTAVIVVTAAAKGNYKQGTKKVTVKIIVK